MPKVGEVAELPQELEQGQETGNGEAAHAEGNGEQSDGPSVLPPPVPNYDGQDQHVPLAEREVVWPKDNALIDVQVCSVRNLDDEGNSTALTVAMAKEFLGWEDEAACWERKQQEDKLLLAAGLPGKIEPGTSHVNYMDLYLLKDFEKKKVRCTHNHANRPFDRRWSERLAQDILNGYWVFNSEPIIIGQYGSVLSGQHRLIALVLAWQLWSRPDCKRRWRERWPTPPTLECLIVLGTPEDDRTIRTLDNVKPRTLSDVVYTSPYFTNRTPNEKKKLSDMLAIAMNTFWDRTRAGEVVKGKLAETAQDQFQTHGSSMDLLEAHPGMLLCVDYIIEINRDQRLNSGEVSLQLKTGKAVAMLYLMGVSGTPDGGLEDEGATTAKYFADRREDNLDAKENWVRALEFWGELAKEGCGRITAIPEAMRRLSDPNLMEGPVEDSKDKQRWMTVCRAWNLFKRGEEITVEAIKERPDDYALVKDAKVFIARETVGGIDLGDKPFDPKSDETDSHAMTDEDIKDAKKQEALDKKIEEEEEKEAKRQEHLAKMKADREAILARRQKTMGQVATGPSLVTPPTAAPAPTAVADSSATKYTPEQLEAAKARLAANQPKTDPEGKGKGGKKGKVDRKS